MNDESIHLALQEQKTILEDQGYNVAYICVYGSQNYGMQTPESDLDLKAVIIPTLDNLINETKPLSISVPTKWGLCDLKDIRNYTETLCKANPVYVESLYTEYYIGTPTFEEIRSLRRRLVSDLSHLFVRGALGQIMMKREALCHPYPSIKDKVEKYGYDPKQLHHMCRLFELIEHFEPYANEPQFRPRDKIREELIDMKTNAIPVEAAIYLADITLEAAKKVVEDWKCIIDFDIKDIIKDISRRVIRETILSSHLGNAKNADQSNSSNDSKDSNVSDASLPT